MKTSQMTGILVCVLISIAGAGFTDVALAFHRAADTIADAAQRGDHEAATPALAATLRTCSRSWTS
jgi:Flp pilus assembly protein TadG